MENRMKMTKAFFIGDFTDCQGLIVEIILFNLIKINKYVG